MAIIYHFYHIYLCIFRIWGLSTDKEYIYYIKLNFDNIFSKLLQNKNVKIIRLSFNNFNWMAVNSAKS